jgi:D-glycero-D-manno-heptose 1,7-bisphosphate phosphatase
LNQAGRKAIAVTNQRGIALGRYTESDLHSIHERLQTHLGSFGAHLDAISYCPHDYGQCTCYKPGIGLFEHAFRDFPEARPGNSVMVGDSNSDIVAGASVGMKTILITDSPSSHDATMPPPSASGRSLIEVVESSLI